MNAAINKPQIKKFKKGSVYKVVLEDIVSHLS